MIRRAAIHHSIIEGSSEQVDSGYSNMYCLKKIYLATWLLMTITLLVVSHSCEASNETSSKGYEESILSNEIDDDRIKVGEPYKSLLQTTARFALAQSRISNHVNMDTAMNILNDAVYILSKPSTLLRVIKSTAIFISTLVATTFLFPGAYKFLDAIWHDPINALNLDRYMSNGLSEKSVIGLISTKSDEALSRVGLNENHCRQRSLCYLGEIIRCTFPHSSETLTRFAQDNFSQSGYKDNKYFKAFAAGFVDQNCTKIGSDGSESHNCLGNFFSSMLNSRWRGNGNVSSDEPTERTKKYQTLQPNRA